MENNRTVILQEIEAELASLKQQILALEDKVAALRAEPAEDLPVDESDFTDMEIGIVDIADEPTPAPEPEPAPVAEPVEVVEEPTLKPVAEPVPEPVAEPAAVIEELVEEPVLAPEPEPAPAPMPEPAPAPKSAPAPHPETERLPWRLDKPGFSVKNIRSGISMYDRALFIGTLFKEDFALYDKTIGELNALTSLDEAVDYIVTRFPEWDLKSGIVYNFMMAIRKKLG